MVYVIHDEENQIVGFSDSPPKDHGRYFQVNLGDAGLFAGNPRTGVRRPHLLEYNVNHQAVGLRRSMGVENDRFVHVELGLVNLIVHATTHIEEAQRDAEILRRARALEKEGKDEEALDLEEPIFLKYQNY
ncbi:MAG: hypothetical protein ABIH28_02355 [archaeon]